MGTEKSNKKSDKKSAKSKVTEKSALKQIEQLLSEIETLKASEKKHKDKLSNLKSLVALNTDRAKFHFDQVLQTTGQLLQEDVDYISNLSKRILEKELSK